MKKYIIFIFLLFTFSCQDYSIREACDSIDCSESLPTTESIVRTDIDTIDPSVQLAVNIKANTYLEKSFRHETSTHYDQYGLHLATSTSDFIHQDDNLIDSSQSLMSMCMVHKSGFADLSTDIALLWTSIKDNLQLPDGRLIRHPDFTSKTSISKDGIVGWMAMLAMAYHTNCEPIKTEAGPLITKFKEYGIANEWEYGAKGYQDSSTTKLTDRHKLKMLLNLYDQTTDDLDLSTSGHTLAESAKVADYINENKYHCQGGDPTACLNIGDAGVFVNNLVFLGMIVAYIEAIHKDNAFYNEVDLDIIFYNLGRIGDSIDYPNHLFLSFYRYFVYGNTATYNDAIAFLDSGFPNTLTGEILGTNNTEWGCTDSIWQRIPWEHCDMSNTEYIGFDFMLLFAVTKL